MNRRINKNLGKRFFSVSNASFVWTFDMLPREIIMSRVRKSWDFLDDQKIHSVDYVFNNLIYEFLAWFLVKYYKRFCENFWSWTFFQKLWVLIVHKYFIKILLNSLQFSLSISLLIYIPKRLIWVLKQNGHNLEFIK